MARAFRSIKPPRRLLILVGRPPDREEPGVGGTKRLGRDARDDPGLRRAIAMVKNGPLRLGVGHRSAVKTAVWASNGPMLGSSTPTMV